MPLFSMNLSLSPFRQAPIPELEIPPSFRHNPQALCPLSPPFSQSTHLFVFLLFPVHHLIPCYPILLLHPTQNLDVRLLRLHLKIDIPDDQ